MCGAQTARWLGICLIEFAVRAMQKDSRIKDLLKIPREENVHAVIAVGHPARVSSATVLRSP